MHSWEGKHEQGQPRDELRRDQVPEPLLARLRAADEPGIETRPVFICSAGARTEIVACEKAGVSYLTLTK
ncbi:MAG: hypothetical protein AAB368_17020, partial [bacterium]